MYLINALPSNGSVNNLNNRETVFYAVGTEQKHVARQRSVKHASTKNGRRCFPRVPCRGVTLKTIGATVQFSVGDTHGKFVFEEELTCELKTLCVL
jgi:hypothetical protein